MTNGQTAFRHYIYSAHKKTSARTSASLKRRLRCCRCRYGLTGGGTLRNVQLDTPCSLLSLRSLVFLALMAGLVGCEQGPAAQLDAEVQKARSQIEPVIQALLAHGDKHGKFPATLEDLGIEPPNITKKAPAGSLGTSPLQYQSARDGSFARIFYWVADEGDYEVSSTALYDSRARTWTEVSHVSPLPYEEAQHFGRAYRSNSAPAPLHLAVASLVDAAKIGLHPCRNLWHDWVFEALGPGQPIRADAADPLTGSGSPVEYRSADGRGAYALVFEDTVHAPMKKPLASVAAIYRLDNAQRWQLVQRCDSSGK